MELNPDQHRLSEAEHKRIFERDIVPDIFADAKPLDRPTAVVFGGQPGAGKSPAVDQAVTELDGKGGCVQIIGDAFRSYHPAYESLLSADDKTAAFYTDRDTGRWVEMAIAHAKEQRVNLVIEGTMRDADKVASTLRDLRDAGYTTHARALAVNERLSQQGILQRYEAQKADRGTGRMTTHQAHQAAYRGVPHTLDRIEQERLADRVTVYRRGAVPIYDNELQAGQWVRAPGAMAALEHERARPFTLDEHRAYIDGFAKLAEMQAHPGRDATAEELRAVQELHRQASRELDRVKPALLHTEAMARMPSHRAALATDGRFAEHTADELSRSAYVRGLYELRSGLEGRPADLARYDATVSDRATARQLPEVPGLQDDRAEGLSAGRAAAERDDDLSL